jgi:8-oxo-dGTP pyrophosphatase MutT (NUDIX family)
MTDDWLQVLRTSADQPPSAPRDPLHLEIHDLAVGSIEPALAQRLVAAGLPLAARTDGWCVHGADADAALADVATWLHAQGLASVWRGELLSVNDHGGAPVAMIERAAVRPLGIATHAVHLVGRAEQGGGIWVQQRAHDKATDPGLWDTLMGGLVAVGESIEATLDRETWEEAGLHVDTLGKVTARGMLTVRRPVQRGYMIEHIHVFEAVIPVDCMPQNQDGEVAAFACLSVDELRERLRAGVFTLEAALILVDAVGLDDGLA